MLHRPNIDDRERFHHDALWTPTHRQSVSRTQQVPRPECRGIDQLAASDVATTTMLPTLQRALGRNPR
ncbi:MAG: hypothetical protein AB2A00_18865 [Myxococcota bacterium]